MPRHLFQRRSCLRASMFRGTWAVMEKGLCRLNKISEFPCYKLRVSIIERRKSSGKWNGQCLLVQALVPPKNTPQTSWLNTHRKGNDKLNGTKTCAGHFNNVEEMTSKIKSKIFSTNFFTVSLKKNLISVIMNNQILKSYLTVIVKNVMRNYYYLLPVKKGVKELENVSLSFVCTVF